MAKKSIFGQIRDGVKEGIKEEIKKDMPTAVSYGKQVKDIIGKK